MSEPVRAHMFCTGTDEYLLSRGIIAVTGRRLPDQSDRFSHCGLAFTMSDGSQEYYEARWGRSVEGPKPVCDLYTWAEDYPEKRRLCVVDLDLPPAAVARTYWTTRAWVGVLSYSTLQLLLMFTFERFGWPLKPSPRHVVCSELVSRVLYPDVILTDTEHPTPDSVNPNSIYRVWVNGGVR